MPMPTLPLPVILIFSEASACVTSTADVVKKSKSAEVYQFGFAYWAAMYAFDRKYAEELNTGPKPMKGVVAPATTLVGVRSMMFAPATCRLPLASAMDDSVRVPFASLHFGRTFMVPSGAGLKTRNELPTLCGG